MLAARRRYHQINQLRLIVHPHVRFHPEIRLIALASLMHFWFPALPTVLRRTRGLNDRCIDNLALLNPAPLLTQVMIDLLEKFTPRVAWTPVSDGTCQSGFRLLPALAPGRCR